MYEFSDYKWTDGTGPNGGVGFQKYFSKFPPFQKSKKQLSLFNTKKPKNI